AEAISGTGVPVLRFDYVSTGDSADVDEDVDHVRLWTQDVIAAIRELRARTGVERVCLLGIRLGALLATLAAAECKTIESLLLLGPVVSGRRYVRDLRTTQLAGIAFNTSLPSDVHAEVNRTSPNVLEAGGFALSGPTLQSLTELDLHTAPVPAVRSI